LIKRWLVFANHAPLKSTISAASEFAILRAGWRCNAPYEWGQHVVIGRRGHHRRGDRAHWRRT
jgi:hypothetical protein